MNRGALARLLASADCAFVAVGLTAFALGMAIVHLAAWRVS